MRQLESVALQIMMTVSDRTDNTKARDQVVGEREERKKTEDWV